MSKKKMTKAVLVENISELTGLSKKDVQSVVDNMIGQLKSALIEGQIIELRGLGTFEVRTRKGRSNARNPRTGQTVKVEDHGVVAFRPGKELKERIWPLQ